MNFLIYFFPLLIASGGTMAQYYDAYKSSVCRNRNGYERLHGKCDKYIECKDYVPVTSVCPDGLQFDPRAQWPALPCGFPEVVGCGSRRIRQQSTSTAQCPRQSGYYPSSLNKPNDCGHYRRCVDGRSIEISCPSGLAYNPSITSCDVPENVPSCNSREFLGFDCPPAARNEYNEPIVTNHKYEGNCNSFYLCMNGNPRLLSCDAGYAYDSNLRRCENADRVFCDP